MKIITKKYYLFFSLAILLILITIVFVIFYKEQSILNHKYPNIVLISVDTLRADHIHVYGYERIKTPNIDKLAEDGVLFFNVHSPIPQTNPSHASILTSIYPFQHKSVANGIPIDKSKRTLTEILQKIGYKTGAFISGYPLHSTISGLQKGFDVYDDHFFKGRTALRVIDIIIGGLRKIKSKVLFDLCKGCFGRGGRVEKRVDLLIDWLRRIAWEICFAYDNYFGRERIAEKTTNLALNWLEKVKSNRFFLWIHYYDPHNPYNPPIPFNKMYDPEYKGTVDGNWDELGEKKRKEILSSEKDIFHMIALYDGEISYADKYIGVLMNKLEELGLTDKTLVVLTADHGESLVDHHYFFDHGAYIYESSIRVPLIFKYPAKLNHKRIFSKVRTIDIMPTIFDMLQIKNKEPIQGKSLLPLIRNEIVGGDLPIFSQTYQIDKKINAMVLDKVSIIKENWKLIKNKYYLELYDLSSDPEELTNLAMIKKEKTRELSNSLKDYKFQELPGKYSLEGIDKKSKEILKSLGYFQ